MKTCTKCNEDKKETEYYTHSGYKEGRTSWCKECQGNYKKEYSKGKGKEKIRAYGREYYKKHKTPQWMEEKRIQNRKRYKNMVNDPNFMMGWVKQKYEGIPCMDCYGVFPWCAMDFDHRPEETKEFGLATITKYKATSERIAKVEKEISKCDLVCASCHRVRTRDRREQQE